MSSIADESLPHMSSEHEETLPLYRHKHLYEFNDMYQAHKFFTNADFEAEEHLRDLEDKGRDDYYLAHDRCCEDSARPSQWRYAYRYNVLKRDTTFYRNMLSLERIRLKCGSYSEYVLRSIVQGIEQKYVDFSLLYIWFARRRYFHYECWENDAYAKYAKTNDKHCYDNGKAKWLTFRSMCKDAFKNGHRGCCKYEEFIEKEFSKI